jgi:hypothetical protein
VALKTQCHDGRRRSAFEAADEDAFRGSLTGSSLDLDENLWAIANRNKIALSASMLAASGVLALAQPTQATVDDNGRPSTVALQT